MNKSYRGSGSGGGEEVDRLAYFARGLALLARCGHDTVFSVDLDWVCADMRVRTGAVMRIKNV